MLRNNFRPSSPELGKGREDFSTVTVLLSTCFCGGGGCFTRTNEINLRVLDNPPAKRRNPC